jgi:hypothetical protein
VYAANHFADKSIVVIVVIIPEELGQNEGTASPSPLSCGYYIWDELCRAILGWG